MKPTQYIKTWAGILLAFLLMWIGVTGRPGSLLGALITPDFMAEGQQNNTSGVSGTSTNLTVQITGNAATMDQISQLAYNAGITTLNPLTTAIAIAMAESGGNVTVVNSIGAVGLWQILISAHPEYSTKQMQDPAQNAAAMYAISNSGTNWCPWQSYDGASCGAGHNHSYASFMVQAAISAQSTITGSQGAGKP